jgi:hypothetical protein
MSLPSCSRRRSLSHTGLGVGLYHAAKQAAQFGYRLTLAANEPGRVCFVLTRGTAD